MSDIDYADAYRNIDFRKHPERYKIGRGEQGVLLAEPYTSELLPHWRFATPALAEVSAAYMYSRFLAYGKDQDFVGMDMARKFLQMGFTRARRYANHGTGHKYDEQGNTLPQDASSETSQKAASAAIFKTYYDRARQNSLYQQLRAAHRERSGM